jgi:hypothetical protein
MKDSGSAYYFVRSFVYSLLLHGCYSSHKMVDEVWRISNKDRSPEDGELADGSGAVLLLLCAFVLPLLFCFSELKCDFQTCECYFCVLNYFGPLDAKFRVEFAIHPHFLFSILLLILSFVWYWGAGETLAKFYRKLQRFACPSVVSKFNSFLCCLVDLLAYLGDVMFTSPGN